MEKNTHQHSHSNASPEETLALLEYMLGHNRHHAQDLENLSANTHGEASRLIKSAVADFESGNDKLEKALNILKGE